MTMKNFWRLLVAASALAIAGCVALQHRAYQEPTSGETATMLLALDKEGYEPFIFVCNPKGVLESVNKFFSGLDGIDQFKVRAGQKVYVHVGQTLGQGGPLTTSCGLRLAFMPQSGATYLLAWSWPKTGGSCSAQIRKAGDLAAGEEPSPEPSAYRVTSREESGKCNVPFNLF